MKRLAYVLLLFVLWFVLSGHAEPYMLALGLASVGISVVLAARMRLLDEEGLPFSLLPRLGRYLAWLVRMIAVSNVAVARIIVNPVLLISPTRLSVKSGARSDLGRVCFANSITLTPGTVTLGIDGDTLHVHALTEAAARELAGGEMDRRVVQLEGRP